MEEIFRMEVKNIDINEFNDYVYNAFFDDKEFIEYYDRSVNAKNTEEAIENVCEKIKISYPDADIFGVEINGAKEGYFVCRENLLISFGMSIKYRNKETLSGFWNEIKKKMGSNFHCMLYSHNSRAIEFLKKCGMKIMYDHITILTNN